MGSAFAAINDYVPIDHSSAFKVTNNSSGQMNIRFTLPDYTLENITVGDTQFQKSTSRMLDTLWTMVCHNFLF